MTSGAPNAAILRKVIEGTPSLTAAAAQLGISRPTLYRWMRAAGIVQYTRRASIPTHTGDMPGDGSAA